MATKFKGVGKIWLYLYLGCNSVTWHAVCRYPDKTEGNMHMHSRERVAASIQQEYSFRHVVYGKTEIVVQNLSHYTQYSISVEACREIVPEEPNNTTQNCSQKSFQTGRTLSLGKSVTFTRQASWFSSGTSDMILKWTTSNFYQEIAHHDWRFSLVCSVLLGEWLDHTLI